MSELLIYRAAAGAGKTHILVTRYIQWALRYPAAFKHILAVTFTNRATQEMKERILTYLYRLSIGAETILADTLCQETGWTVVQLQLRSKEILSMMVYQYGDFSVTTIDSFFHKIIQSFAQSLGLSDHVSISPFSKAICNAQFLGAVQSAEYSDEEYRQVLKFPLAIDVRMRAIEMDEPLALTETIEELLTLNDDSFLQQWIVDFALSKLSTGKSWNVKSNIQELGKALFNESFKLHETALLAAFQQQEQWPRLLLATQAYLCSFEQRMQQIGYNALTILKQEGLTPADFSYGTKGVIGYFLKLTSQKDLKPTKRALIASETLTSWYPKQTTHQTAHISKVVKNLLHPLLMQAITLYEEEGFAYRSAIVGNRFTYAFGMIGALLIGLERYRTQHHLLFMSDIAALLYQAIQGSDTPFLYEKIGNQFHHFLIDEFQDLSMFQWMNIKPLLRNSLAEGYSNLLVGDVKQSIYRWRGSNWKLLNHEVQATFKESTIYHLTTNRRSAKAIILFNNHLFSSASNQLMDYLASTLPSAFSYELAQMRRVYEAVSQQTNAKKGGYVELFFLRSGEPIAWKIQAQQACIDLLERLQKEGIPAKDIVVLVRNHSEATLLTSGCNHASYKVATDHAHALWRHIAIKVLIHALYYLNDEHDVINKIAWIAAYCSCMGHDVEVNHHDRFYQAMHGGIEKVLPQSFWRKKDFLKQVPFYTCVHLLIGCLFKTPNAFSDVLVFFQSIVLNCREATSIASFLTWWEKRGCAIKLPTSHDDNVIRVMTIHQAKGLAFKVTIIPFCSWGLDHSPQNGPILWSLDHPQQSYFPIWPVAYGSDLKETCYAQDYYLERLQIHLDNLNLLYVAFTRAETQLYAMAPLPEKIDGMATIADLLYQSLQMEKIEGATLDRQETAIGTKICVR